MSLIKSITSSKAGGYLLLGVVGIGALVIVSHALSAAINQAVGSNSDKSDGASGSDGTTRIDPASQVGGGGAVGLATAHGTPTRLSIVENSVDGLFGGGLSRFGGWVGEKIFAPTSASGGPGEGGSLNLSNYNQTGNPYSGGQTSLYADTVDAAPTPAAGGSNANIFGGATAANPNAQTPLGPSPADQIVWN